MIFGSSSFSFGARFPDISEGLTFTVNLVHDFFRLDFAAKILVFSQIKKCYSYSSVKGQHLANAEHLKIDIFNL